MGRVGGDLFQAEIERPIAGPAAPEVESEEFVDHRVHVGVRVIPNAGHDVLFQADPAPRIHRCPASLPDEGAHEGGGFMNHHAWKHFQRSISAGSIGWWWYTQR